MSDMSVATLALYYRGEGPVLVALGGTSIPARLDVVDPSGRVVAVYEVDAPSPAPAPDSDCPGTFGADDVIEVSGGADIRFIALERDSGGRYFVRAAVGGRERLFSATVNSATGKVLYDAGGPPAVRPTPASGVITVL
ncbi:hypothetical protein [Streptomyces lavendulae]|uniref:hypothetical protein n=1 Tax=Streptomyces lavendulae TaxID=1914 RepID=UPI0024A58777|nr:hypothetical protein [Streptomyces lavendulae]GLW03449.1 hypothetical protein Slala05_70790 [Streptomyces lavendulae subsp. lavendulae]